MPDTDLIFIGKNGALQRGQYPLMFVASVEEVEQELGLTTFNVAFEGMKTKPGALPKALKQPYVERTREIQTVNINGVSVPLALPSYTITRLVRDLDDLDPMNQKLVSGDAAAPDLTYEGITIPTPTFAGFRKTGEAVRLAGRIGKPKSILYEVTETISYTIGF